MYELKPITAVRVCTTAGTPEKVKETPEQSDSRVVAISIVPLTTNTNVIYFTNPRQRATGSTTGLKLSPGQPLNIDLRSRFMDKYLDLAHLWFDAAVSGEGFSYIALAVENA